MILFFAKGECDSDALVKYCYSHYADITGAKNSLPRKVEIVRAYGEKPRFGDGVPAHFSVSHSHGVVMVGISHTEIGVDIEKIRPVNYSRFSFIEAEDEGDFFRKWTERESYLKFTGVGLKDFRAPIPEDAHFEHFDVFDDYDACVCAEEQDIVAYMIDLSEVRSGESSE